MSCNRLMYCVIVGRGNKLPRSVVLISTIMTRNMWTSDQSLITIHYTHSPTPGSNQTHNAYHELFTAKSYNFTPLSRLRFKTRDTNWHRTGNLNLCIFVDRLFLTNIENQLNLWLDHTKGIVIS